VILVCQVDKDCPGHNQQHQGCCDCPHPTRKPAPGPAWPHRRSHRHRGRRRDNRVLPDNPTDRRRGVRETPGRFNRRWLVKRLSLELPALSRDWPLVWLGLVKARVNLGLGLIKTRVNGRGRREILPVKLLGGRFILGRGHLGRVKAPGAAIRRGRRRCWLDYRRYKIKPLGRFFRRGWGIETLRRILRRQRKALGFFIGRQRETLRSLVVRRIHGRNGRGWDNPVGGRFGPELAHDTRPA
jgi:hypothetical protein